MNKYFRLDDIENKKRYAKHFSARFERIETIRLNNLKDLIGRLPEENEFFFIETRKSVSAFTFIPYVINNAGRINNLFIATYSINSRIINALCRFQDKGLLANVDIEIGESIKYRSVSTHRLLEQMVAERNWLITYAWTHRKISCMETDIGKFVSEGSGNFGENAQIEQYLFYKSEKLYEFRNHKAGNLGR